MENCQVGVFLSYVTAQGHALIDRELYLPDDWCADPQRRQTAHIPEHVSFASKPELAQRMVERTQAAPLPIRWVVADSVYGHATQLRCWLEHHGFAYVLAVPCTQVVCVQTRTGLVLSDVGSIVQQVPHARDWHRLSQSMGTKGERLFDWMRLPIAHAAQGDERHFLDISRHCSQKPKRFISVCSSSQKPRKIMLATPFWSYRCFSHG